MFFLFSFLNFSWDFGFKVELVNVIIYILYSMGVFIRKWRFEEIVKFKLGLYLLILYLGG